MQNIDLTEKSGTLSSIYKNGKTSKNLVIVKSKNPNFININNLNHLVKLVK